MIDRSAPVVHWQTLRQVLRRTWQQGEHVSILGPTGSGKTHLALALVQLRSYVVIVAAKARDDTLSHWAEQHDYKIVRRWPPPPNRHRVILWPPLRRPSDMDAQSDTIGYALEHIFSAGGWTVLIDEASYIANDLRLDGHLKLLWSQGRSNRITLIAGTQRPRHVPMHMWDQPSHLFLFRYNDRDGLQRISGLGAADSETIRQLVPRLERHQFLYVDLVRGHMCRSTVV